MKQKTKGLVWSVILGSLVVHVVGLALFGLWVVSRKFSEPAATFTVPKTVRIPVQTPEHKMNMAAHEAMAPKPTFSERLVSSRPAAFSLPDLPDVEVDQALTVDPSMLVSDQAAALAGSAGFGSGLGNALAGSGGKGSGMSFFDIDDTARSIVLMIDVSASMFGRTGDYDYSTSKKLREGKEQSFQRVRNEAMKVIDGLDINSRFNIIHWSGSARLWREGLVAATDGNKAAAKKHIQDNIDVNKAGPRGGRPGGTRHDYALEALFDLAPEVAFMLTDGNATASKPGGGFGVIEDRDIYSIISDAKKENENLPRIHTLYYLTGNDKREEEKMLRGISRRTGGKFRKVKVEKTKDK